MKTETMQPVSERLEEANFFRIYRNIKILLLNECYLSIGYIIETNITSDKSVSSTTGYSLIPTKDIRMTIMGINFENDVIKNYMYNEATKKSEYSTRSKRIIFEIESEEDDILPRMEKAFKHLSSFCKKEESKETF